MWQLNAMPRAMNNVGFCKRYVSFRYELGAHLVSEL